MMTENASFAKPFHMYLSPHFDDAILACGGLMHRQRTRGERVAVITIFGKGADSSSLSAFARHLHAKWRLADANVTISRQQADIQACKIIGVSHEHCDFIEAPYRRTKEDKPLYCTYATLAGRPLEEDAVLTTAVTHFLKRRTEQVRAEGFVPVVYLPIDIFGHVDHYLLCQAVYQLADTDAQFRYYDPWPSVEKYSLQENAGAWKSSTFPIDLEIKTKAVLCYRSQIGFWGGTEKKARERLKRYALNIGKGQPAERIWEVGTPGGCCDVTTSQEASPFSLAQHRWRLRDFRIFLRSLKWNDLREFLPVGTGTCLDVGCGTGPHKEAATKAGYTWIGLDYPRTQFNIAGDAHNLPVGSEKIACVIFWTVTSLLDNPARAFKEIHRVLEPGGVLCGSSSFLEPVHGQSTYGMSHVVIERILRTEGFSDIVLIPDIPGFALILWTFLRRYAGYPLSELALPLTRLWLLPLAFIRYFVSFLWYRMGRGTAFGMEWIVKVMPLEFAGHVIFLARKK
ncbi:MAG: methyltransferase domain-containing protein [Candidatus Omnitrophica bacterium]|nr:methyltransferase domain-containing protein [Candidatus Omnitrophota bacterium]